MTHDHSAHAGNHNRAFALGVLLNIGFVIIEVVYGIMADSLALLADAGHNLSDVLGLLLAWGAAALASKPPDWTHSYGYRRATILASLTSALLLFGAVGAITWEAMQRFQTPQPPNGMVVLTVAAVGIVINTATAALFIRDQHHDLNIRGAFLHMAADAAVSAGVVVAGLGMMTTGWLWLDPLVSLLVVAVIIASTWGLFHESLSLAMDRVPRGLSLPEIDAYLRTLEGVTDVHDLHVWALSTTETALTAHLVMPGGSSDTFLTRVAEAMQTRFGIGHTTIQVEAGSHCCPLAVAESL